MSNQKQTNYEKTSLLAKNVDIEPTGIIYNIKSSTIENFVEDYLMRKGVDGIAAVRVKVEEGGRNNPYASIYLFMSQDSKYVTSDINNIPAMLRNKVDKINVRLTEEFKKILHPLCGLEIKSGKVEFRDYFVQLNIFRVIGLMFAADPAKHKLIITEAKHIPGSGRESILSVIKSEKIFNRAGSSDDKYGRLVESLDKR